MGWYAVLRGILLAGAAVLLLGGTGNAALAQNGEAASPSLHGLQLGVGLSAGRPYLLGDMGNAWRGVGTIGVGLGPDVTLDYFGDRVGVGLALEFMPTHVGDHSARAISGAFMLHWRPGPARAALQPMISVGMPDSTSEPMRSASVS